MNDMTGCVTRRATVADVPAIVALLADDALGQLRETVSDPAYLVAFDRIDVDPNHVPAVMVRPDWVTLRTMQLSLLH